MANDKPEIGVRAVVENAAGYERALASINKTTDEASRAIARSAESTKQLDSAQHTATGSAVGLATTLGQVALVAGAVAVAITGVIAGMVALGQHGAQVEGVTGAFDALAFQANTTADLLLGKLREASRGTISDFELMKSANLALAGATGEVAEGIGKALPELLEIARVQARATGQDINFLYNSLITGIKRGSPLLIDNTGLVLSEGAANEAYAAALGKTVEQMTAQEKQMALLQATLEAGRVAVQALGDTSLLATDKLNQAGASFQNLFDKLGVMLQPIAVAVGEALAGIADALGTELIEFQPFLETVVQGIANFIKLAGVAIAEFIGRLKQFVIEVYRGGVAIISALAKGFLYAYNTFVAPAILAIARGIANFLIGLSPPPEGPLSQIDKGGANVMKAWMAGFMGAGIDPVERVAAQVNQALGGIGSLSLDQVKARLAQLDIALAPFQQRLSIVKAEFDALKEPVDAAFRAIDRQLEKAVQALATGDEAAAALVRSLDSQRAALEDYTDMQQEAIDNAQLQLSLAQAQQARERTLLGIRQSMFGEIQKTATVAEKVAAATAAKKPKGGGGAKAPAAKKPELRQPETEGRRVEEGGEQQTAVPESEFKEKALTLGEELANITAQAQADLLPAQATKAVNDALIKVELDKIASVNLGDKLRTAFENIFDPNKEGSALWSVIDWFKSVFDPERKQSIPYELNRFVTETVPNALSGLGKAIQDNIITPVKSKLETLFNGGEGDEGSIRWFLNQAVTEFGKLPQRIGDALRPLAQAVLDVLVNPIINVLNGLIGGFESLLNGIIQLAVSALEGIADGIPAILGSEVSRVIKANIGSLKNLKITIGRIAPVTLSGGATGGLFGPGIMRVGERGEELVASGASKMAVFPNQFVRALDSFNSLMARPAPMVVPSGGDTYHNSSSSSMTNNFYDIRNQAQVMTRLSLLKAGRR